MPQGDIMCTWPYDSHEHRVEKFYSAGIDGYHEHGGGSLNFGFWKNISDDDVRRDPVRMYSAASSTLVCRVAELAEVKPTHAVLNVGCGMGHGDVIVYRHFSPAYICGLDVTRKHIERARERIVREGIPEGRILYRHGSATNMPFVHGSFDRVISIEAPEHFDTREDFFYEAYRVLKPGGVLAFTDYSLMRPPRTAFERLLVDFGAWVWCVPSLNIYGNETFVRKLKRAGFWKISIDNIGAHTIPGYYKVHRTPEMKRSAARVRGFLKGVVGGFVIDWAVYQAYLSGLCEYVLVRAVKP